LRNKDEVFDVDFKWPSAYQQFIYKRTYARWLEDLNRREKWPETIKRYYDFFESRVPENKKDEFLKVCESILNLEVVPSMRALWSAGKALERDNTSGYNCSYLAIDNIKAFAEMFMVLLAGCGIGFSVERQYINSLPSIPDEIKKSDEVLVVKDSKLGWAEGLYSYIKALYEGKELTLDLSKVRPAGSLLKTFGGRASGPEPYRELIQFITNIFKNSLGRKLNSLEVHDICCKISEVVVVGGTRRAACISLSNLSDERMRHAKDGEFWMTTPWRSLTNNSVAYTEKPSPEILMKEWISLIRSKSGERGIFNREGAKRLVAKDGRRDTNYEFGTNPCCLPADTLIKTDKGNITIKELIDNIRDYKILTYDINSKTLEYENIIYGKQTRKNATLIELELEDGERLKLTPDHKVYTENRGYIEAAQLTKDDILLSI